MIVYFLKSGSDFLVPVCQVKHLPYPRGLLQRHNRMPGVSVGTEMGTL